MRCEVCGGKLLKVSVSMNDRFSVVVASHEALTLADELLNAS